MRWNEITSCQLLTSSLLGVQSICSKPTRVCYGVVWQRSMQSIPNDEAERNRTGSSQSWCRIDISIDQQVRCIRSTNNEMPSTTSRASITTYQPFTRLRYRSTQYARTKSNNLLIPTFQIAWRSVKRFDIRLRKIGIGLPENASGSKPELSVELHFPGRTWKSYLCCKMGIEHNERRDSRFRLSPSVSSSGRFIDVVSCFQAYRLNIRVSGEIRRASMLWFYKMEKKYGIHGCYTY